ncbi:putative homogentisate phytyltransferase 1 [Citrus sinensis]|uniref:Homogentisate phytyltransferase 1 n=1 Tax=Citrus sinensis TaxID=2711 RepID=A0ACB8KAJ4_CITSI|nr:putative homogentisate phytyltransferase 1 [Citrus sinensis]
MAPPARTALGDYASERLAPHWRPSSHGSVSGSTIMASAATASEAVAWWLASRSEAVGRWPASRSEDDARWLLSHGDLAGEVKLSHGDLAGEVIVPTLLMNTFLTALNQICDVEIDKINKPYLPLASGDLSRGTAMAICIGSAILSFTLAIMSGSPPLLSIQILGFLSGCAYSLPLPFLRWKSHTFMAPLCLVIMMGLTALPFCMHMQQYVLGRPFVITRPLIFMVAIMSIFAFVNGLLKDLPDVEGDKKFGMNTLCVVLGKEKIIGHSILALILWIQSKKVDLDNFESTFGFCMLTWKASDRLLSFT